VLYAPVVAISNTLPTTGIRIVPLATLLADVAPPNEPSVEQIIVVLSNVAVDPFALAYNSPLTPPTADITSNS